MFQRSQNQAKRKGLLKPHSRSTELHPTYLQCLTSMMIGDTCLCLSFVVVGGGGGVFVWAMFTFSPAGSWSSNGMS